MMRTKRGHNKEAWALDQLTKSQLFHAKLHEWGLLEIAREIEVVRGERLSWDKDALNIAESAWNKVIHRGIKPVRVFAHPSVLIANPRRVGYYRMLAMVSQKSMNNVGLPVTRHEVQGSPLTDDRALAIACHLNRIISVLVDADAEIDAREFDLWRGMAAGAQAQGTSQNVKGQRAEKQVRELIEEHLRAQGVVAEVTEDKKGGTRVIRLTDGRRVVFASDPDTAIYTRDNTLECVAEIKGGIDTAGVLERLGATLKSLQYASRRGKRPRTVLLMPATAMTARFRADADASPDLDAYFAIESVIADPAERRRFFAALSL
ncbi:MAG: XcyI family restriction endonuclease [Abditibacteriales bacterium]|nr:XcyI family restriction endonuclease [Abditibacteriales bacterium]MDW8365552.1 XcyI family restriction endonuclease [Abditibacteriales bacterium]